MLQCVFFFSYFLRKLQWMLMKETTAPITLCCIMNSCEKSKSIKQTCQNLSDNLRKTLLFHHLTGKQDWFPLTCGLSDCMFLGVCCVQVRFIFMIRRQLKVKSWKEKRQLISEDASQWLFLISIYLLPCNMWILKSWCVCRLNIWCVHKFASDAFL